MAYTGLFKVRQCLHHLFHQKPCSIFTKTFPVVIFNKLEKLITLTILKHKKDLIVYDCTIRIINIAIKAIVNQLNNILMSYHIVNVNLFFDLLSLLLSFKKVNHFDSKKFSGDQMLGQVYCRG